MANIPVYDQHLVASEVGGDAVSRCITVRPLRRPVVGVRVGILLRISRRI